MTEQLGASRDRTREAPEEVALSWPQQGPHKQAQQGTGGPWAAEGFLRGGNFRRTSARGPRGSLCSPPAPSSGFNPPVAGTKQQLLVAQRGEQTPPRAERSPVTMSVILGAGQRPSAQGSSRPKLLG